MTSSSGRYRPSTGPARTEGGELVAAGGPTRTFDEVTRQGCAVGDRLVAGFAAFVVGMALASS